MAEVRDKYHISLHDKGYILRGAPDKAAYSRSVIRSQVDRMAISDLAYSDFAGQGLFYLAQTDWSAGFKSEKKWRDDAKFYYSTNLNCYLEQGCIQLEKALTLENDFAEIVLCGGSFEVNGSTNEYVGCEDDGSGNVKIYKYTGSWADIAGTDFNVSQDKCTQLKGHKNTLYALTYGGNSDVVATYNGSAWTDHTIAIIAQSTLASLKGAHCSCEVNNTFYVFVYEALTGWSLMSTVNNGTNWVEEQYKSTSQIPISCVSYNEKIYYLTGEELRVFDPSDSTDIIVKIFNESCAGSWGCGDKYLVVYKGKLIITFGDKIYEYNESTLLEIWSKDSDKDGITGYLAEGILDYGAVEYDGRLHWGDLIYDGEVFYNWKRPNGDSIGSYMWLLYVNNSNVKRMIDSSDRSKIWKDNTTYKTTIANNYLIFNEMSPVSQLDKLLSSITIIFDTMSTGESIKLEYSLTGATGPWTTVGTRSYSAADSATKKEWNIPGSVVFNKVWWRISLDGSATTPKVRDFIMAYRPMPDYKNRWDMRLNFSESVKLLNRQTEQRTGQELNAELWNEKATKQSVVFKDIDYIECDLVSAMTATGTSALVDSTKRFPRQGRIRAVSGSVAEEMTYTSAHTNKLFGISRGQRGTTARAYLAAQALDSAYDVYIEDIRSEVNFTDEKKTEHIAQVLLIEA